ncbi:MAG: hypothetical protein R3C10_07415 [Pirellulales bacterium]
MIALSAACAVGGLAHAQEAANAASARSESATANSSTAALAASLERLIDLVPPRDDDWSSVDTDVIAGATDDTEASFAAAAEFADVTSAAALYEACDRLLAAKRMVDELLDQVLARRTQFADARDDVSDDAAAVDQACRFLRTSSELIDLSGRLRYTLADALRLARDELLAQWADQHPGTSVVDRHEALAELLSVVARRNSSIGASVLAPELLASSAEAGAPPPRRGASAGNAERQTLALIASCGDVDLLDDVVRYVRDEHTPDEIIIEAAETIRALGLPQDARPDQDPSLPQPVITAAELRDLVMRAKPGTLPPSLTRRRDELLAWLTGRAAVGLESDEYRVGNIVVRPGDWLLMRNPSPYNLFSALTPGLFTHVGVVALETGSDGRRRMVIVDLPERGTSMPATNVEVFLQRTLHYAFMRDRDADVAGRMGEAARSVIGNEVEFDLNFRTDGIDALAGQPLARQKIKSYCAGLLLLTAQASGIERTEFFPLYETPAGGNTIENLHKIGLVVGDTIVSPTAALFSPRLQLVGRRRPMYEPTREIQEAAYDHFAAGLASRELRVAPTVYQSLRLRVAEFAEGNDLLSRAVAGAAGVNPETDLVAAAKAAAVVELLDRIAYQASDEFLGARYAVRSRTTDNSATALASEMTVGQLRARHAELRRRWTAGTLTPRQLRIELVDYYIEQSRRQLDERFFSDD